MFNKKAKIIAPLLVVASLFGVSGAHASNMFQWCTDYGACMTGVVLRSKYAKPAAISGAGFFLAFTTDYELLTVN